MAAGSFGTIIKSTDGGVSWTEKISGTTSALEDISFYDENNGIIAGESGVLLKTSDGGETWNTDTVSNYRLR